MNTKPVSPERAAQILRAYGASPEHWPESERDGVWQQLQQSSTLSACADRERYLDERLSGYPVAPLGSLEAVLDAIDRLPSGVANSKPRLEQWLDWLVPRSPVDWWRGVALAALPLALGVGLGALTAPQVPDWSESEQYVFAPLALEVVDG